MKEREREGRREGGKKGKKKKREKELKKAASKQQGQSKSKRYRQIMYLDIMHGRLQSVMINLFRLLLYQCFINIPQLPAARISYQYNSLSKTLLRRGLCCSLVYRDPDFTGSFSFVFLQH